MGAGVGAVGVPVRLSGAHAMNRCSESASRLRCWERAELDILLARHGFGKASFFGAYDPSIASGTTDRIVVVAQRFDTAA